MLRLRALLLATAITLPLLAGCLGDASTDEVVQPFSATPEQMAEGAAYSFHHGGGALRFSLQSGQGVAAALYSPDDERLGLVELGSDSFRHDVRLDNVRAGEYVLHVVSLNGTLAVHSAGTPIGRFAELGSHFERVVLADRPFSDDMGTGVPNVLSPIGGPAEPLEDSFAVDLERTPTNLRLRVAGHASDLALSVRGTGGTVLAYGPGTYATDQGFLQAPALQALAADFNAHNVRSANLSVVLSADDFAGVLILEAWSYSRVGSPLASPAFVHDGGVPFTYGLVPDRPVVFSVSPRADVLYAWTRSLEPGEGTGETGETGGAGSTGGGSGTSTTTTTTGSNGAGWVSGTDDPWLVLFDDQDRRIGAYQVPNGTVLRIPLDSSGDHVAVAKGGDIYLGADRAPVDFQMNVLDVVETVLPMQAAGESDRYGQRNGSMQVEGVPFGVRPTMADPPPGQDPLDSLLRGCTDPGTVRITVADETAGFVGSDVGTDLGRLDLLVGAGPGAFIQDGIGGTCGHHALAVRGYLR